MDQPKSASLNRYFVLKVDNVEEEEEEEEKGGSSDRRIFSGCKDFFECFLLRKEKQSVNRH